MSTNGWDTAPTIRAVWSAEPRSAECGEASRFGAAETDHHGREHAGTGGRYHDANGGLPAAGAERERGGRQVRGHARKRVLRDREDDRNDREPHREADHETVALVIGDAQRRREPLAGVAGEEHGFDRRRNREREPAAEDQERDDQQEFGPDPDAAPQHRRQHVPDEHRRRPRGDLTLEPLDDVLVEGELAEPGLHQPGDRADGDARDRQAEERPEEQSQHGSRRGTLGLGVAERPHARLARTVRPDDMAAAVIKEAMQMLGYCANTVRLPLTPMLEEDRAELCSILADLELLDPQLALDRRTLGIERSSANA